MASLKGECMKSLYADRKRSSDVQRISFSKIGFIEIGQDGYIHYIKVRREHRGKGWGDRIMRYAKRLYGDTLYSHAVSPEGYALLSKHAVRVLTD